MHISTMWHSLNVLKYFCSLSVCYPHDIIDVDTVPTDNMTEVVPDVITSHECIPTPMRPLMFAYDNANTFTFSMRQSLAQCINLQRIHLRPTNYTCSRI